MDIPNNWITLKLKEVVDYEQPAKYIITTPILEDNKLTPVLTPNKSFVKGYTSEKKGIYTDLPAIIFDDFTADYKFVDFQFKVKSSAMKILSTKHDNVLLKFIFYQMFSKKVDTQTHKRYYISAYSNLDFSFPASKDNTPDFVAQETIVAEIEKQFTRLDKSIQTMNIVKTKLGIYKKSILKKAFDKDSKVNRDKNYGSAKLSEIFKIGTGATPRRGEKKYYLGGKVPWITSGAVNKDLITDFDEGITDLALKETNCKVYPKGSLIIAMYGEGKTRGKVSELGIDAATNQACAVIVYDKTAPIDKRFLKFFLKTKYEFMRAKASGGVQPNLNLAHIKNMGIIYPVDMGDQIDIVQEIESQISVINKMGQKIDSSLLKAELLRKSLLKSAFEGKLVGEWNDRS
jgi:type I restriction enzyme S subunit